MKKLLAFVLSIVMAVSLTVPAFASGPRPDPRPGGVIPIGVVLEGLIDFG